MEFEWIHEQRKEDQQMYPAAFGGGQAWIGGWRRVFWWSTRCCRRLSKRCSKPSGRRCAAFAVLFALSAATHLAGKCGAVFAEPFYLGANKHENPAEAGLGMSSSPVCKAHHRG